MIVLELVVLCAALVSLSLLIANQVVVQWKEYSFYKANGWDFSVDSGHDKLKVDKKLQGYDLGLNNWQRFYIFRPVFLICVTLFLAVMIWSLL